jgi:hypothetical protein
MAEQLTLQRILVFAGRGFLGGFHAPFKYLDGSSWRAFFVFALQHNASSLRARCA